MICSVKISLVSGKILQLFAINSIYGKFTNNIDQNLYTYCLFLNLSKAFDTVGHDILLNKLYRNFGIRGKSLH